MSANPGPMTTPPDMNPTAHPPLSGIRVLELGQLIAGPFCARLLADFGADVIKVEAPGAGDPLRNWRLLRHGTSLWWHVQSRNKKSVAIDLRHADGQALVRTLASQADVVVENFRPGALEQWNLGYETLSEANPGLVMVRISGYGQTGPYRDRPGFGVIGEAMGGLRYLTAEPGRIPVRVGVSIGDSIAALHGMIGLLMALYNRQRQRRPRPGGGRRALRIGLQHDGEPRSRNTTRSAWCGSPPAARCRASPRRTRIAARTGSSSSAATATASSGA